MMLGSIIFVFSLLWRIGFVIPPEKETPRSFPDDHDVFFPASFSKDFTSEEQTQLLTDAQILNTSFEPVGSLETNG